MRSVQQPYLEDTERPDLHGPSGFPADLRFILYCLRWRYSA